MERKAVGCDATAFFLEGTNVFLAGQARNAILALRADVVDGTWRTDTRRKAVGTVDDRLILETLRRYAAKRESRAEVGGTLRAVETLDVAYLVSIMSAQISIDLKYRLSTTKKDECPKFECAHRPPPLLLYSFFPLHIFNISL